MSEEEIGNIYGVRIFGHWHPKDRDVIADIMAARDEARTQGLELERVTVYHGSVVERVTREPAAVMGDETKSEKWLDADGLSATLDDARAEFERDHAALLRPHESRRVTKSEAMAAVCSVVGLPEGWTIGDPLDEEADDALWELDVPGVGFHRSEAEALAAGHALVESIAGWARASREAITAERDALLVDAQAAHDFRARVVALVDAYDNDDGNPGQAGLNLAMALRKLTDDAPGAPQGAAPVGPERRMLGWAGQVLGLPADEAAARGLDSMLSEIADHVPIPGAPHEHTEDRTEPPPGYTIVNRGDDEHTWWDIDVDPDGDPDSREATIAAAWAHRDAVLRGAGPSAPGGVSEAIAAERRKIASWLTHGSVLERLSEEEASILAIAAGLVEDGAYE